MSSEGLYTLTYWGLICATPGMSERDRKKLWDDSDCVNGLSSRRVVRLEAKDDA